MSDVPADDRMDRWAMDWKYETDSLLVHSSGFAVQFDTGMPRSRALGEIVASSVAGYAALIEDWAKEPNADELLRFQPLLQAAALYLNRPAGTIGAPARAAE